MIGCSACTDSLSGSSRARIGPVKSVLVHRVNAFPALKTGIIVSPDSKSKTKDSNVVKDGTTKIYLPRAKAKIVLK